MSISLRHRLQAAETASKSVCRHLVTMADAQKAAGLCSPIFPHVSITTLSHVTFLPLAVQTAQLAAGDCYHAVRVPLHSAV
jgi:hypothetical protein